MTPFNLCRFRSIKIIPAFAMLFAGSGVAQVTFETDFANSGYGTNTSFTWATANGSGSRSSWNSSTNAGTGNGGLWVNGAVGSANNAVFGKGSGTTGYTVTLAEDISVGTMAVVNGPWSIALSTFTLTLDSVTSFANALAISGSGGLTKINSNTVTLNAATTYTGATTISAGSLKAGAVNVFSSGSDYTISSGATLDLGGNNNSVKSIAGAGTVTFGAGTLTIAGASATSFTGNLGNIGTGGLTINNSSATLTLSGSANASYTGTTTLTAGTLAVSASSALSNATGTVSVQGGTLSFANTLSSASMGGSLSMSSGTISLFNGSHGTLTLAAGKDFSVSGGTLKLTLGAISGTHDTIAGSGGTFTFGGTLDLTGSTAPSSTTSYVVATGFSGYTINSVTFQNVPVGFNASWVNDTITLTSAIPEPSTYAAMFGGAVLALAIYRRRKTRTASGTSVEGAV
jgi:autotransporter-associated beta strand protein